MRCFLWVLLANLLVGACCFGQVRTWTDREGRTMEAALIGRTENDITIRRADGQRFTVPITRFSQADRRYIAGWSPPVLPVPELTDAVFIVNTGESTGSGFLLQDAGLVYFVTNQHVIQGHPREAITVTNPAGQPLALGRLEIIPDADIARILVDAPGGLKLGEEAAIEAAISTVGNSDGAGVLTINRGEIVGLGTDLVEVSAEIIPGNSGGPILDSANEVIGVATFISTKSEAASEDWKIKDTRYAGTRRFGLRLLPDMPWQAIAWGDYVAQGQLTNQLNQEVERWLTMHKAIFADPSVFLDIRDEDSRFLREVAEAQNAEARRFDAKLGNIASRYELRRMNRFENRKLGERMRANLDQLERRVGSFLSINREIDIPFFVAQIEDVEDGITTLRAWLESDDIRNRQFFRFE